MNLRLGLGLAALSLLLIAGCASQPPQRSVYASAGTFAAGSRIGVAMTVPKIDTSFPGAGCLLCLAAASAANSSLTEHARSLPSNELLTLKNDLAEVIRKKGAEVVVIAEDLNLAALPKAETKGANMATKDFSAFKDKYKLDKLLVIEIRELGFQRSYASYIPSGDPRAVLIGNGYLVNLGTGGYDWYKRVYVTRTSDGKWDEPPKFPGLTNAYYQVIELGKDDILKPLAE